MLKLTRGLTSITLPNPSLGDGLSKPIALKVIHLANGTLRSNRIQKDLASKFVYTFAGITRAKRTELETFLSGGLVDITLYNYDSTVWKVNIVTSPVEYTNVGRNECYDLYSFQLDMQGKYIGPFGELTTEDDIVLVTEDGIELVTESTPE